MLSCIWGNLRGIQSLFGLRVIHVNNFLSRIINRVLLKKWNFLVTIPAFLGRRWILSACVLSKQRARAGRLCNNLRLRVGTSSITRKNGCSRTFPTMIIPLSQDEWDKSPLLDSSYSPLERVPFLAPFHANATFPGVSAQMWLSHLSTNGPRHTIGNEGPTMAHPHIPFP